MDKWEEDMITLTGYPEWATLKDELTRQIYQAQGNLLENATNWDDVMFGKGWCKAFAYIINLRDNTKLLQEAEKANADL